MAERGILDKLAFKGGTCLRKMFIGSGGRFSTDLDFTRVEEHDHEDVILAMMEAFEQPFHGIRFGVPDDSYYETQDGLSWGGQSGLRPRLEPGRGKARSGSRSAAARCPPFHRRGTLNAFRATSGTCLSIRWTSHASPCPKIIAEKVRACYQRSKARDVYDLSVFATRPLDRLLIRRLVVLKIWQAGGRVRSRKRSWRNSTMPPHSIGTISGN